MLNINKINIITSLMKGAVSVRGYKRENGKGPILLLAYWA